MKPTPKPTVTLSDKKKQFIKFVCSPGTAASFIDGPNMVCPTGEKCLVMREMRMKQITLKPDADGKIIILNTPFFEAPFIRVETQNDVITKWYAFQIPGYPGVDPLKENQIYAWRMIANSVTGVCNAAPIEATGSVTVASLPLSLDIKHVYAPAADPNIITPIAFSRCLDYIPLTADAIAGITNQFTTHKAVEGSYCVLKHTDPDLPFTYRDSDMNKATFNVYRYDNGGNLSPTDGQPPVEVSNVLEFANANTYGTACLNEDQSKVLAVSAPSCMNLGLTIFSGLKANTPYTFKSVVAWEFVPKMNSSKISQCRQMEPKDPFFLHILNCMELRTRSYGTAADNSLGTFVKGILEWAGQASPYVKEIAAALPLPPKVQVVVDRVTEMVPKINQAVQKVSQMTSKNAVVQPSKANSSNTTNSKGNVARRK